MIAYIFSLAFFSFRRVRVLRGWWPACFFFDSQSPDCELKHQSLKTTSCTKKLKVTVCRLFALEKGPNNYTLFQITKPIFPFSNILKKNVFIVLLLFISVKLQFCCFNCNKLQIYENSTFIVFFSKRTLYVNECSKGRLYQNMNNNVCSGMVGLKEGDTFFKALRNPCSRCLVIFFLFSQWATLISLHLADGS